MGWCLVVSLWCGAGVVVVGVREDRFFVARSGRGVASFGRGGRRRLFGMGCAAWWLRDIREWTGKWGLDGWRATTAIGTHRLEDPTSRSAIDARKVKAMHDAQPLLTWSGYPGAGEIRASDGTLWAAIGPPLLAPDFVAQITTASHERLVCRSGSLAGPAFETWGPKGWAALEARCAEVVARGSGGGGGGGGDRVVVLPHAADVLSDLQRCRKILEKWGPESKIGAGGGIGLVVDPAALLTETMMDRVAEHFERLARILLPLPGVEAVVVPTDSASSGIAEGHWELMREAAQGCGVAVIQV